MRHVCGNVFSYVFRQADLFGNPHLLWVPVFFAFYGGISVGRKNVFCIFVFIKIFVKECCLCLE